MRFGRLGYILFTILLMGIFTAMFYSENYVDPNKCRLAGFKPAYGLCWRN